MNWVERIIRDRAPGLSDEEVKLRRDHFGVRRYCPVCRSLVRQFIPHGVGLRPDAKCPICMSVERHRLIWCFFNDRTNLFDGRPKRMLHVAPEAAFRKVFETMDNLEYVTADMVSRSVKVRMDVQDIPFKDRTFHAIYCSHVLEHVPDDRKAMREFKRVLKRGGWAILQVPIKGEATYEDPSIQTEEERERAFGQKDHVRRYGPDYADRLREAGFEVAVERYSRRFGWLRRRMMRLDPDEDVYFCRRVD